MTKPTESVYLENANKARILTDAACHSEDPLAPQRVSAPWLSSAGTGH
ncbi:hypothetical protein [Parasedimentitalea marina]|nr:hypothetical protein [Parasedimentitalea marina]